MIEILTWRDADAPDSVAKKSPSVQAIWDRLNALVEKRGGKPAIAVQGGKRRGSFGRDAGIRTRDPLNPIQVRYQTAPRPDRKRAFEQEGLTESNGEKRRARPVTSFVRDPGS